MNRWYVVQTKPKKEESVARQLTGARYEVFFPKMRTGSSPKPLFPSYLFVSAGEENPWSFRLIRFTRGVRRLLGDGPSPHPISDEVVETLKGKTADGSLIEQELLFKEGDQVNVRKGILRDLVGIITKNVPADGRVKVLFKWMYGTLEAFLKYTELEKVA